MGSAEHGKDGWLAQCFARRTRWTRSTHDGHFAGYHKVVDLAHHTERVEHWIECTTLIHFRHLHDGRATLCQLNEPYAVDLLRSPLLGLLRDGRRTLAVRPRWMYLGH